VHCCSITIDAYIFPAVDFLKQSTPSRIKTPLFNGHEPFDTSSETDTSHLSTMGSVKSPEIVILGAGVIGLTSSLVLAHAYPSATITVVAKHFPGDRSIEYASPWAGANWSSMANDNGVLERYDEVTFKRFGELIDGKPVHGCKALRSGEGNEIGLGRQEMWAVLDARIEETNLLTPATGKIWYDELVGGLRNLSKEELPRGAVFGLEFPATFRINTQVYLQWYDEYCVALDLTWAHKDDLKPLADSD
jgi:D-amino-acid oxidase